MSIIYEGIYNIGYIAYRPISGGAIVYIVGYAGARIVLNEARSRR